LYIKIRKDGALGFGRGTEGVAEITLGYGEAHMAAAALEKLAQTARSYKQTYVKTTGVGGGNKIDFERADDGTITISGDGHSYFCTEKEVRDLAELLNHLPPVQVSPASDYVQKIPPEAGICITVKNGGKAIQMKLPEAALMKTAVVTSLESRFYEEHIVNGNRRLSVQRSSDLKWELGVNDERVKFTAYEIEALLAGLQNSILDVLMDLVKSMGADKIADIRVKSQIQRVEQESLKILGDFKKAKTISKNVTKSATRILGTSEDADARTTEFIEMAKYVYSSVEPQFHAPLFDLLGSAFVFTSK